MIVISVRNALPALALLLIAGPAMAKPLRPGGKLPLTSGISTIEGAGGGGLASWALISGNDTRNGIGGAAAVNVAQLPDFQLRSASVAVGLFDRVELSYARQQFDTDGAGAALGLGRGFTFDQHVLGAKLRLVGDAVYDQDRWWPQVAIGVQHRINDDSGIVRAVGAGRASDTDFTLAMTKILLRERLVLNGTLRLTRANQFGLLGYGGDRQDDRRVHAEASAGFLLSRRLLIGGEYRSRPDNLGFARERDAFDVFLVRSVGEHLAVSLAYVDLGPIATFENQRGALLQLQGRF